MYKRQHWDRAGLVVEMQLRCQRTSETFPARPVMQGLPTRPSMTKAAAWRLRAVPTLRATTTPRPARRVAAQHAATRRTIGLMMSVGPTPCHVNLELSAPKVREIILIIAALYIMVDCYLTVIRNSH